MSALLQGVPPKDAAGRIIMGHHTQVPHHFANGLPYEVAGVLAIDITGAISHYAQGLPFTANGRLVTSDREPITYYGGGAAPFDANGRLAVDVAGPITHWSSGVPYTATGHIAAI